MQYGSKVDLGDDKMKTSLMIELGADPDVVPRIRQTFITTD